MTALAGGMLGTAQTAPRGPDDAAAKEKCRRSQQSCTKTSQCCGRKKHICGFSHGGGTTVKTCCGQVGASCPGNELGCCVPLVCTNGTCAKPVM